MDSHGWLLLKMDRFDLAIDDGPERLGEQVSRSARGEALWAVTHSGFPRLFKLDFESSTFIPPLT